MARNEGLVVSAPLLPGLLPILAGLHDLQGVVVANPDGTPPELLGPGQVVAWDVMDWMVSPQNEQAGQDFHELLEEAKTHADSPLPTHDDDPAHDRAVGAAVMMCQRGQARKGVVLYNVWAAAAGYEQVKLLSEAPPVVDILDAIVGLNNAGELEVLSCRSVQ